MKQPLAILILLTAVLFQSCGGGSRFSKRKYLNLKGKQTYTETQVDEQNEQAEFSEIIAAPEIEKESNELGPEASYEDQERIELDNSDEYPVLQAEKEQIEIDVPVLEVSDPGNIQLTKYEAITERYIRRSQVTAVVFGILLLAFVLMLLFANLNIYLVLLLVIGS